MTLGDPNGNGVNISPRIIIYAILVLFMGVISFMGLTVFGDTGIIQRHEAELLGIIPQVQRQDERLNALSERYSAHESLGVAQEHDLEALLAQDRAETAGLRTHLESEISDIRAQLLSMERGGMESSKHGGGQ